VNTALIAVLVSAFALVPSLYAAYNTWINKSSEKNNIVFKNALELVEANKRQSIENQQQAERFRDQLNQANTTIGDLTTKLYAADRRAEKLSQDLAEANSELIALRAQIESMSKQVDGDKNGRS
jgi:septal ring factor EnvC (AmiA/AmiB activator)